ncbi:MAG: COG4315 family predicted lipoprotein, partial [Aestuariivirgaceae bacterium]
MKTSILAFAALFLAAAPALAAEPAKTMDTSAGKVYTDEKGMTLYIFDKDEANKSNCYDDCAKNWPPLMAAADAQPEGEWTIVERTDGTKMWAYEGKPVYTFVKDTKLGDVTGDGVGGV